MCAFNNIFSGINFIKLTNETENHHNFQFQDGLNIDTNKFAPIGSCNKGGIYFIDEKEAYEWIWYNSDVGPMIHMRKVIIPSDARVYIEDHKFKADKIILGSREKISKNIYIQCFKKDHQNIEFIPNEHKNKEMCELAVTSDGLFLKYVPDELKDENICVIAVNKDCIALRYVPHIFLNYALCMDVVKKHGRVLKYVLSDIIDINRY